MDDDPKESSINWGADKVTPAPSPPQATARPAPSKPLTARLEEVAKKRDVLTPQPATPAEVNPQTDGGKDFASPLTGSEVIPWRNRIADSVSPGPTTAGADLPATDDVLEDEVSEEEEEAPPFGFGEADAATPEGFRDEDFDDKNDEPFDRPGVDKIGIIGGKGVGKSYLFQSMVYRTFAGQQSGALTYYLENDAIHLFIAAVEEIEEHGEKRRLITRTGLARTLNRINFIKKYKNWQRLPTTRLEEQQWYRLRMSFRTGWLGQQSSALDVEFFDGSGEGFFQLPTVGLEERTLWRKAYRDARVMIFCLPLWVAFPNGSLTDEDWDLRERVLTGFEQVVQNYRDMRRRNTESQPVRSILALTMSDDQRSALRNLYDRWIFPYLDSPYMYLKQLRTGRGVARYLANARQVSEAVHEEFLSARDPRVAGIPQTLDFGRGRPWIVAVSAMDGARLEDLDRRYQNPDDPARAREARNVAPTPVHVELPLLLALCERENALM